MRLNSCTVNSTGHITKLKRDYSGSQYYAISCSENIGDNNGISIINIMENLSFESGCTFCKNDYGYSLTVKQIRYINGNNLLMKA